MPIPEPVRAERARVAAMFLAPRSERAGAATVDQHHGMEIGALDEPTPLPPGSFARYVDFRSTAELAEEYPELDASTFAEVDVIDDGERLETCAPASVDFLIANQMLEHCENPLGTLRRHLRVVRPGGWLFYAVPDRRVTFDHARPLTTFEHLVADDRDQGASSRFGHYLEWARLVEGVVHEGDAKASADLNLSGRYSIHFHVWDAGSWIEFLVHARGYLDGAFEIRYFDFTGTEILCVLRRA